MFLSKNLCHSIAVWRLMLGWCFFLNIAEVLLTWSKRYRWLWRVLPPWYSSNFAATALQYQSQNIYSCFIQHQFWTYLNLNYSPWHCQVTPDLLAPMVPREFPWRRFAAQPAGLRPRAHPCPGGHRPPDESLRSFAKAPGAKHDRRKKLRSRLCNVHVWWRWCIYYTIWYIRWR